MWKLVWEDHGGVGGEELFTLKMEQVFKNPLARQIRKGVEIEMSRGQLMNSKSEWNNAGIPRIVIETGEKLEEDQESGLGRKSGRREVEARNPQAVEKNEKRRYEENNVVKNHKKRRICSDMSEINSRIKKVEKRQSIDTIVHRREVKEKVKRGQLKRGDMREKVKKGGWLSLSSQFTFCLFIPSAPDPSNVHAKNSDQYEGKRTFAHN